MQASLTKIIALIQSLFLTLAVWLIPAVTNKVLIPFDTNASTGYSWVCEMEPEGIVKIEKELFKQPFSFRPIEGGGAKHIFVIAPVADGETTLTFYYMRVWEGKDSAVEIVNYTLTVSGGNIEMSEPVYG